MGSDDESVTAPPEAELRNVASRPASRSSPPNPTPCTTRSRWSPPHVDKTDSQRRLP
ncbi:hypothetical protein KCP73_01630 [Salmonella enterica subsp. enterica]|nr:hypothetical protein KCP73_01630 [Salmonella enterica subsp. enterica]